MSLKRFLLLALIGALLGGVAAALYKWQQSQGTNKLYHQGAELPSFSLPDVEGNVWRAEEWRNKILLINFWATWCPPCRDEMPLLVELQNQYREQGLLVVGIAIDDKEAVLAFMAENDIEFPVLLGGTRAIDLGEQLGNRFGALPFTVVADRYGHIVFRQAGPVHREQLKPLLDKLTRTP